MFSVDKPEQWTLSVSSSGGISTLTVVETDLGE